MRALIAAAVLAAVCAGGAQAAPAEPAAARPASQADAGDLIEKANARLNAQDPAGARQLMEQAAATGDPEAINGLAVFVSMGVGGDPDEGRAEALMERALASGSVVARSNLGARLIGYDRTAAENARGFGLLSEAYADDRTKRMATGSLGKAYLFGWGVEQDMKRGVDLLEEADRAYEGGADDSGVLYLLGRAYDVGWGGRSKDSRKAYAYFLRSAEMKHPRAAWIVGMMLLDGRGAAKNEVEAYRWVRKAAEAGELDGQISTAVMLATAQGVEEDDPQARVWYQRAAERGSAHALRSLGSMYFSGEGGVKNQAIGIAYIELAMEAGDHEARKFMSSIGFRPTPAHRAELDRLKAEWVAEHGKPDAVED